MDCTYIQNYMGLFFIFFILIMPVPLTALSQLRTPHEPFALEKPINQHERQQQCNGSDKAASLTETQPRRTKAERSVQHKLVGGKVDTQSDCQLPSPTTLSCFCSCLCLVFRSRTLNPRGSHQQSKPVRTCRIYRQKKCPFLSRYTGPSGQPKINNKTNILCYKCITGTAPSYLCDCLQLYTASRALRSASDILSPDSSHQTDSPLLVPVPFLFSVHQHGMTSPSSPTETLS